MYYNVERIFMDLIDKIRRAKGLTATAVANAAWPAMKDAGRRYRFLMTDSSPTGKALKLTLSDCIGLARAVGEEPSHLIWEAMARDATARSGRLDNDPAQHADQLH